MLSSSDFVRLPYPPDLTEAGIQNTCRWLAGTSHRLGENPYNLLRRKIGQVAVELAFRRLLAERHVSSQTMELEPFTEPLQHDLSLGGHRLHLTTTLLTRRQQISSLRADPDELLQASSLVPLDHFLKEGQTNTDIYLFAFLLALEATSQDDQLKVESRGQPHYYFANLPVPWSRPDAWIPLRPLAVKSEADHPVTLELGGQNADRRFILERLELLPLTRTLLSEDFYSLAFVHSLERPGSRQGFHSSSSPETHIIAPTGWGNIWLYGLETWFAGWLTHGEYRRRSFVLPAGQHTFQYAHTRFKNLCVPIKELRPLNELFEHLQTGNKLSQL
jgi:hypothetical protein